MNYNCNYELTENEQNKIIKDFKVNSKIALQFCEISGEIIMNINSENLFCYKRKLFTKKDGWKYLILLDDSVNCILHDVHIANLTSREQALAILRREYFKRLMEQYKIEIDNDFKKEIDNLNGTLKDYKLLVLMLKQEILELNKLKNPTKRGNL